MKIITNTANYAIDLYDTEGNSCTIQPGTCKVEDKFTVNLPPKIILKGE